ncbi:carnitine O-palmitoyltransferase 2, mitochondrial [Halyomorpha halys]|uniref:carnitine O-palmitoyltransferase 2, mitochondrial n=1 Tax=Halyomorpha halys TaxID=286706 RepID=UPI0006D50B89|nr:carnitine O-palmitoyltransferase 2, mitochondrial-like [Halyomorpha halys]
MFPSAHSKKLVEVWISFWPSRLISSISSDEYQYLQKSKTPTMHFQPSLPRLPIPELSKSCERYLNAQKPLRSEEEFSLLVKRVKEFESNAGIGLQKELKQLDLKNKHTSYISAPWFEMYLKDRKPLPINYNPFLVFIDDPKIEYNDQLVRSANLLISSLRFMRSLRNNYLEPEVYHLNAKKSDTGLFRTITGALPSSVSWYGAYLFKAFPLDMSQYKNLFNTSRIPGYGKDRIFHDPSSKHIIIMKNGNVYKLNVLDENGQILDPVVIYSGLKLILDDKKKPAEFPVGILTTEDRDIWSKAREHLESLGNAEVFKMIDNSILNLIFDDEEPTKDYKTLVQRYLHSNGLTRWFDKSFSLIVGRDGTAGLNFEHSWGDGVAILRYFTDIYKDSTNNPQVHPTSKYNLSSAENLVSDLVFNLDNPSKEFIVNAKNKYSLTCDSLDIELLEFLKFGRKLCKSHDISPDSIMQLAFQLAYYKLKKSFASTYESCSTAAFKHGRTETVRPCTVETKKLCEAIIKKDTLSKADLLRMMKECSLKHGQLIKEAAMGQGFDRHLFALNLLAQKNGKIPSIFSDPLYQQLNHYVISTSTLNSDFLMLGAFGPVVPEGYGIGYSIWDERLGAIVSFYKNKADGRGFISCLEEALFDLYGVLNNNKLVS